MGSRMLIRFQSEDDSPWSWVSLQKNNQPSGDIGWGDLQALAAQVKGKRPVLVLPGRSLLITQAELPEGSHRTISAAIPYALEEQLAEEVDLLHFAQGKRAVSGLIPVVVIAKQRLAEHLEELATVGIEPVWAVPEPLLLPWRKGEVSIRISHNRATVRMGATAGFECTLEQLPTVFKGVEAEQSDDYRVMRVWTQGDPESIDPWFQENSDALTVNTIQSHFECLTELGQKRPLINVLQDFETRADQHESSGTWWPAVALLLLAIFVYLSTLGYQVQALDTQLQALTQKSEALVRDTFPEIKRLVDLEQRTKRKLAERKQAHGQGADNLLSLLTLLGQAKQKQSAVKMKSLEYRQNNLIIYLEGPSVAQIEQFKQALESNGDAVSEILSTVSRGEKIEARIKLKGRAS